MNPENLTHDDLINLIEWNTKVESYENVILMINDKLLELLKEQQKEKDNAKFIILQAQIKVLEDTKARIRAIELDVELMIKELKEKKGGEDDD